MNNNLLFTLNRHIRFQICLIFLVLFGCARAEQIGPTEIPTVTPISGWHMLENEGFQLWVPDSYVGGTSVDIDKVIQQLTQMGPDFAEVAKSIKQSNVKYILFAIDTKSSNPGKVANMLVGKENVPSSLDVAGYLETLSKNLLSE